MIGVSVFGSGRMGEIFTRLIADHPIASLISVMNPNLRSAKKLTDRFGGQALADPQSAIDNPEVDAVIISTPTSTHLEMVVLVAKAGKAILCEKPLDLSLERVDACLEILKSHPVPLMLGFNRRFDPQNADLQQAVRNGEIGDLSFLMLTSREPAPPPISYVKTSGGFFSDATIHDIDMICWITGERPHEVFATGSYLVDPEIGAADDVDTTMTVLKMPSGALVHVNNSRQCSYGFDQRIEAFGSKGMVQTTSKRDSDLIRWGADQTEAKAPLQNFFLERYAQSFQLEVDAFLNAVRDNTDPTPDQDDGRTALAIALACDISRRNGRTVKPVY